MMDSKFIPTLQVGNGYTYLKLRGVMDEDNFLSSLLSQIQGRLLLVDLAEIERINSCGVRDWVNWLNQIQALGLQVILLRCSPAVISQANMVTNFAADAFIHSFFSPYVHPDTGDEQSVLLFTEDIRQVRPVRAPKIFSEGGEELEFDEFEESYFAFVNDPRIMGYQISDDIQAVIQYFLPEAIARQPVISAKASVLPSALHASAAGPSNCGANLLHSRPFAGHPNTGAGMSAPSNAAYASSTQNPYASGTSPFSAQQQGYGAPSAAKLVPQPASPVRHEQPPIPSAQGYQQAARMQAAPPAPMPSAGYAQPMPSQASVMPQPAPHQPVPQRNVAQPPPQVPPHATPARPQPPPQPPAQDVQSPRTAPAPASLSQQSFEQPKSGLQKNERFIIAVIGGVVLVLIIVLVLILLLKR
ncbi:MAG: hypothetical protein FWC40_01980 [Proteobacteria bacterium]|nr:hypothetical protein [Pseudomonadota bacterium]